jgi:hypothetical protein
MKRVGVHVLFVGEYRGQGATRQQFVKTMATAGSGFCRQRPS